MIDPTDFERDCMNKALRPLGEYVADIGTDKAFQDLTREQFMRWVWAGGRKLKGLVRRRAAESDLYAY